MRIIYSASTPVNVRNAATNAMAALPSQAADSLAMHSAVVEAYSRANHIGPDPRKQQTSRKAKKKSAANQQRAQDYLDRTQVKVNNDKRRQNLLNRVKHK